MKASLDLFSPEVASAFYRYHRSESPILGFSMTCLLSTILVAAARTDNRRLDPSPTLIKTTPDESNQILTLTVSGSNKNSAKMMMLKMMNPFGSVTGKNAFSDF